MTFVGILPAIRKLTWTMYASFSVEFCFRAADGRRRCCDADDMRHSQLPIFSMTWIIKFWIISRNGDAFACTKRHCVHTIVFTMINVRYIHKYSTIFTHAKTRAHTIAFLRIALMMFAWQSTYADDTLHILHFFAFLRRFAEVVHFNSQSFSQNRCVRITYTCNI